MAAQQSQDAPGEKTMPQRFERAGHSIYWGDVLDVLPTIPDESVDLLFADPPYNIGKRFASFMDSWPSDEAYAEWCYKWLEVGVQKLRPTGSMYVMTSTQAMPMVDLHLRRRVTVLSRVVWAYDSSGVQAKRYFGSLYEPILHCVRDPKKYTFNGRCDRGSRANRCRSKAHRLSKTRPNGIRRDEGSGEYLDHPSRSVSDGLV